MMNKNNTQRTNLTGRGVLKTGNNKNVQPFRSAIIAAAPNTWGKTLRERMIAQGLITPTVPECQHAKEYFRELETALN